MTTYWDASPPSTFLNEADVEQRLILPLLYALGYQPEDVVPKPAVVFREGRRGRKPEADFVCYSGLPHDRNNSLLVVEAKAPNESLQGGKEQGESYAANLRAPILLMTNGSQFEVWQLQSTKESARILEFAVVDLLRHRGSLEGLLSKKALVTLCERLGVKSFAGEARRHPEYLAAEAARCVKIKAAINRTLRYKDDGKRQATLSSEQLISFHPEGAIVLAPSGYGKSTLSQQVFRQALEESASQGDSLLVFSVPLSAIGRGMGSLLKYLQERLAAHSPGTTMETLRDNLRHSGGVLVCDSFDRIPAADRMEVQSELSNIIRDYPLLQLVVLSREAASPDLPLPVFDLLPPSEEEMRHLEALVLGHTRQAAFVISTMPRTLRNICENILVARLVLDYWREHGHLPLKLGVLFRAWIDRLLDGCTPSKGKAVWLESALALLAGATIEAPIAANDAASLLKAHQLEPNLLEDLIECDALSVDGVALEVRHEALADYLRAQRAASAPEAELISNLRTMVLPKDSLFPTLLMSQLRSRQSQSILWKRLSEADLGMYLDALRYRFDLSDELGHLDQEALSRGYLEDLLDGIEIPVDAFCPLMREPLIHYLTLKQSAKLGVTGIVLVPPIDEVAYGFRGYLDNDRIVVSRPKPNSDIHATSWLHLGRSGYRLDSGRLLGATRLRDTLLKLVENQEIEGGTAWITERLVSRIWYLQRSHRLDINEMDSFEGLDRSLQPHVGKWVERGDGQPDWFSIDSMLRDIAGLRAQGKNHLDLWWKRCGWISNAASQALNVIESVLAEFYRRQQVVLAEIVERSFPDLSKHMASYTCLPARWEVTLIGGPEIFTNQRVYARWKPVASWNDAGADVIFSDSMPPWRGDKDLRDALRKFGRPNDRFRIESMGIMPSFEGNWWDGRFKGATAVVREACLLLTEEIKYLFSSLPSHEAFNKS